MATATQLKMLVKSHFEENNEKFNTIALQIAAHEAKLGHTNLANDIRKIIDASKTNAEESEGDFYFELREGEVLTLTTPTLDEGDTYKFTLKED